MRRVVVLIFDGARDFAEDGLFDDAVGDGVRDGIVHDDFAEEASVLMLGGRREVELGGNAAVALRNLGVQAGDDFRPLQVVVVEVVAFVVHHEDAVVAGDEIAETLAGERGVGADARAEHARHRRRFVARRAVDGRVVEALHVRQIERAARLRRRRVVAQHDGELPVRLEFRRNERILAEDAPVLEVGLEALVDDDVRRDEQEDARHFGARRLHDGVEV